MSERVDFEAERGLIGALLNRPQDLTELDRVTVEDFEDPRCAYLFGILTELVTAAERTGAPVQLPQVNARVLADRKAEWLGNGTLIFDWYREAFPASLGFYAERVRESSTLRRFHRIGGRLQQAAEGDDLDAVRDLAAQVMTELYVAVDDALVTDDAPVPGLSTWEAFVDDPTRHDHDWVIPGLLERPDRVICVAAEGSGKSVLGRQVAIMAAAGRQPFFPDRKMPPVRTLVVDLENPPSLVRRQGGRIVDRCRELGIWQDGMAFRWTQPDGIDIRQPADARLLERVIREVRPDLMYVGPLYKLASTGRRGETYELVAEEIRAVLDHLRGKYRFALWLEHHVPKAQAGRERDLDPLGSSVWLRWPEFGLTLRREFMGQGKDRQPTGRLFVGRYRPDREEGRCWPASLVRGDTWPWRAEWSDAELAELDLDQVG